jgi:hypothetical protein
MLEAVSPQFARTAPDDLVLGSQTNGGAAQPAAFV